ncbi:glutathione S-transferase family protein [Minwuia sp.]|uniref:glutathione S-transferase family protein n=1 Tax=Minwuia sp. TaxID=2493630 RepID=UPI003A8F5C79
MYQVVGKPNSRVMRIIWMLEELGEPYEIIVAAQHTDEVTKGNPGGKMPVLRDGGTIIPDSVAICTYLADKHGKLTAPAGTPERGRQDAMTQFCVDEVEGALWTAAKNDFIHPEEVRTPEIRKTCEHEFAKAMRTLEKHLADREFVTGAAFTVPDLLLGHCAGWAKGAKFSIPEGPVEDYFARVRGRDALKRAVQRGKEATEAAEAA